MDRNEIEELIEWHEAEASRLADRNIPNVNLDKHQRSANALRHLLQAQDEVSCNRPEQAENQGSASLPSNQSCDNREAEE